MRRIDQNRITIQDRSRPERGRFAEVRVSRDMVRRGEIVNIRVWYVPKDKEGEWFPTRQGISLPVENVVDLVSALAHLFPEAIEQLLDADYQGADEGDTVDERERAAALTEEQRLEDVMAPS